MNRYGVSEAIWRQLLKTCFSFPQVERVILYGSRACGNYRQGSDIDLAIDASLMTDSEFSKLWNAIDDLPIIFPLDVVHLQKLENEELLKSIRDNGISIKYNEVTEDNPLKQAIDHDAVLLYKRDGMSNTSKLSFELVGKAIIALKQMVEKPMQDDRSNIDACIQRFEFTIELFLKLLKKNLESKGQEATYPKDILREAFKGMLINEEGVWLQMLEDRNKISHAYNQDLADEIYNHIITIFYPILESTYIKLKQQFSK